MLNKIKKELYLLIGKKIKISVDVGRNKKEEYIGTIDKLYCNVWGFKTADSYKCFSYKDVLIKDVIISPF